MKESAKYAKIVEWSDEDQWYVGSAPGLLLGGCHGKDEKRVFDELCQIVEKTVELCTLRTVSLFHLQRPAAILRIRCSRLLESILNVTT